MKVDSIHIAGMNGIQVPDGTNVDSEFTLTVRVKVFAMQRQQVDVSTYDKVAYLPGPIELKLLAVDTA